MPGVAMRSMLLEQEVCLVRVSVLRRAVVAMLHREDKALVTHIYTRQEA